MIVPNAPTAYPTPPEKPMSLIALPCGVGVPHAQPDWPSTTCACADVANAAVANSPHRAATHPRFLTLLPSRQIDLSTHRGMDCDTNGNGRGEVANFCPFRR